MVWGRYLVFEYLDPQGYGLLGYNDTNVYEVLVRNMAQDHMSHSSLGSGSQVFPTSPYKAQYPLIVPNGPYWVALAVFS